MQVTSKILFFATILLLIKACIEPFTPNIDENQQYLVINGNLTSEEGYQYVEVSRSASYNNRDFIPLNDCDVKIIDNKGNVFQMELYFNGKYQAWIDKKYLQIGNSFKLEVILDKGKGKRYESDFDTLYSCPEINEIYYEFQDIEPDDPSKKIERAVQFLINFDASGNYANNYRWEFIETWEYHSKELIWNTYHGVDTLCHPCLDTIDYESDASLFYKAVRNDTTISKFPTSKYIKQIGSCLYWLDIEVLNPEADDPVDTLFICWKTEKINDIFTYTTKQKTDKNVNGLPLINVTNKDEKLKFKYSVLVKQLTLSDAAFKYWNHLENQSKETGGLYETQPYQPEGNLRCVDDENEEVLGFFSVSAVKTKRFTHPFRFNPTFSNDSCLTIYDDWDYIQEIFWTRQVVTYLLENGDAYKYVDQACFDCRMKGGINVKPDYW